MIQFRYKTAPRFWRSFKKLSVKQKKSTETAWKIFKKNPFDPQLRTHRINSLSAAYRRTIYAVDIESDLRAVFYLDGDVVYTVDIGSHDLYKT